MLEHILYLSIRKNTIWNKCILVPKVVLQKKWSFAWFAAKIFKLLCQVNFIQNDSFHILHFQIITNQIQLPHRRKSHVDKKQNDNVTYHLEPSIKLVPKDLHHNFTKEQMILKIDPMHCKRSICNNTRSEERRCSCEIRFMNSKLIEERIFVIRRPIASQGHCRSLRCMRNFVR